MSSPFSQSEERLISTFRGFPVEESSYQESGTKALGSLIETCIERHHIGRKTPEETIQDNWERIVGKAFCKRCRPERIDSTGALVIAVSNATVRRELIFAEDHILTVVRSLADCHHINRIVLKAG